MHSFASETDNEITSTIGRLTLKTWQYCGSICVNGQEEQGAKVVGKGIIPTYQIDDIVKVRAGYEEVKKRTVVGQWTTEATISEVHETTPNFYKLKWITRGLNKEAVGAVSKRGTMVCVEVDGEGGLERGRGSDRR